jgi:CDP-diacylglycerol---serine O-phosphatidyltransferase
MKQSLPDHHPRHRGIYLLPNLFTMGALFAGFYAIVAATKHSYDNAAIAIFIAILLDGLDGRVARMTHSVSDFGAQFDSLSDMLCFGITPAMVLYSWSLSVLGKPGWLVCFAYTAATALRLARFNTQLNTADKRYFQGLSTTISAGFVASLLWACVQHEIEGASVAWWVAVVALLLATLKVSSIRYRSFKDLNLRGKVPFLVIPAIGLIFVLVSYSPPEILLLLFFIYVASGPVSAAIRWFHPPKAQAPAPHESLH